MRRKATKFSNHVKAGLALNGLTVAAWARMHGFPMTTVHQAVHEKRNGKTTKKVKAALEATCLTLTKKN